MSTTFDEVLLDKLYSALADGGPEFATAIVRSGSGGSIASRAETREDYQSKYEISYAELDDDRRKDLRSFAILRKGMARGFRFLAPDDHTLSFAPLGVLNGTTGDVELMNLTNGVITDFYVIQYYTDGLTSYVRRIVKLSPYSALNFGIYLLDAPNPSFTVTFAADNTFPIHEERTYLIGGTLPSGVALSGVVPADIDSVDSTMTVNYYTGKVTFSPALPSNYFIRCSGQFHLPVAFTDDWQKFSIDETAISSFKVGVEELLPTEIGIPA